jgi:methylglutaconyl-CoA hydratase
METDAPRLVLVERQGSAAWLTLCRPEAANALSRAMVATLTTELKRLRSLPELTAVIVTGVEGKAFCAGADLKERMSMTLDQTREYLDQLSGLVGALADFPRPVIAAISGAALGGGLEIALACDFRIADTSASVGLAEVRLGIIPGAGGTQRLARLCGMAAAKELVLTGRRIDANRALALGLVSQVVPLGDLRSTAAALAADLSIASPLALEQAKRAMNQGLDLPIGEALALERQCYEVVLTSDDRNEGLRAFAEKRAPRFTGK